jgi:outer membrane protein OmpA-like peptidoglycan-associated protein
VNPVTWWHNLQGGAIAEQRPPPPGADQPYPNLATVPPAPAQPDRAALANISNALIGDRVNAQHVAATEPLPDPSLPGASPGLFGRGTVRPPAPPSQTPVASATMAAAEAAPPPPTGSGTPPPPAKAPVGAVQSAPLAPPGAAAQPPSAQTAALPQLPAAPPPPPNLPGVPAVAPPQLAAGATPPQAAPAVQPPASSANTLSVTFLTGSAELQPFAANTLKQLAARRGNGIIAVTGYGDTASNDPGTQSAALSLGLSRAQAMAAALTSAGVPPSAVQVDAAAVGRGGTARLIQ